MKPLTRDIVSTLTLKLFLLTALWFICFRQVEKPAHHAEQWLLNSTTLSSSLSQSPKQ
ncbi:cytochrome oxidase putative small subunit CydP [Legionella fairfieldensis]|uniref:cytochrome oxidase putative small subunit CydP n=1 Tax=Legionella fairfieldensis TaxID=45064 RepID=UPI000B0FEBA1|nr:cytochrome oxidase putative small subunit CydP [Legionella fairfieldensis]